MRHQFVMKYRGALIGLRRTSRQPRVTKVDKCPHASAAMAAVIDITVGDCLFACDDIHQNMDIAWENELVDPELSALPLVKYHDVSRHFAGGFVML